MRGMQLKRQVLQERNLGGRKLRVVSELEGAEEPERGRDSS
jgi:hypothetical protein